MLPALMVGCMSLFARFPYLLVERKRSDWMKIFLPWRCTSSMSNGPIGIAGDVGESGVGIGVRRGDERDDDSVSSDDDRFFVVDFTLLGVSGPLPLLASPGFRIGRLMEYNAAMLSHSEVYRTNFPHVIILINNWY